MTYYSIAQAEDAIVAALAPLKTSIGVRTVKTHYDQINEEAIRQLAPLMPCLLVAHAGTQLEGEGTRQAETMNFVVLACDISKAHDGESRRGSATNPGTLAMLAGARTKLLNKEILIGGGPCKLKEETNVFDGDRISIYRAHYSIQQWALYQ